MVVEFMAMKPQLIVEAPKAVDAVRFYKTVFGTVDNGCTLYPKCKAEQEFPHILYVQLEFTGSTILIFDIGDDSTLVKSEKIGCVLCIETEDIEAVIAKVVRVGAVTEGDNACCGGCVGKVKAPYRYGWLIYSFAKKCIDIKA